MNGLFIIIRTLMKGVKQFCLTPKTRKLYAEAKALGIDVVSPNVVIKG